jgi:histidinol-phosphate aminotransferase
MESQLPQVRRAIRDIPAYVPGKPPRPRPGVATYKLSSNENPNPPLPGVLEAAVTAAETMNRYPDMGCTALYSALGERLGVPAGRLAAGAGSVAVLYHLLQAFCEAGDEVVYAWRSFEAYPIAVAVTGATSVQVPLADGEGGAAAGRHDLEAMADAITDRTKVVIVCSPNNPTGPAVGRTELERFLDRVPTRVVVVLDEAYREFVRPAEESERFDGVELSRGRPNVVDMMSFV